MQADSRTKTVIIVVLVSLAITCELNWTKKSIFYKLSYWSELELKHNMDVMHIEKNVCENLLGTMLSLEKKN